MSSPTKKAEKRMCNVITPSKLNVKTKRLNIYGYEKEEEDDDYSIFITQSDQPVVDAVEGHVPDVLKQRSSFENGAGDYGSEDSLTSKIRRQLICNAPKPDGTATYATNFTSLPYSDIANFDLATFYGLPLKVQQLLHQEKGISKLYDWQHECLNLRAVQEHQNLIYSLPTSGGKTLVAEILILKEILCLKKDCLFILPFVSIVQEKVRSLSTFAIQLEFCVEEYAGSKGRFPVRKPRHKNTVYIATFEKAHSIVNNLLENDRLDDLGLVVVDELHMIGEGGKRGAILESTLTKLLLKTNKVMIIGMSATLGNMEDLKRFLNAEIYRCDFRPVELKEYIKLGNCIYALNENAHNDDDAFVLARKCNFNYNPAKKTLDPDHLTGLVLEVIPQNSCLIFCSTKKNCENVAKMICDLMPPKLLYVNRDQRRNLCLALCQEGNNNMCPILRRTLPYGVGYHHSGLTHDERRLLEEAYLAGTLCCLTCTSTLAAGVNLPAKRVILRAPYVGTQFLSRSQYKQMIGRAGRAGMDVTGESILICQIGEEEKVSKLLQAPLETCSSSMLGDDGRGLQIFLLSSIGLKLLQSKQDVDILIQKTLLGCQARVAADNNLSVIIGQTLEKMTQAGVLNCGEHNLEVSLLGRAAFKASIETDMATKVLNDLHSALKCLALLKTDLHLLFIVTPYDMMSIVKCQPNLFYKAFLELNEDDLYAAEVIGIPESCVFQMFAGKRPKNIDMFVVDRFYTTLVLYDLWKQKSVWEVASKFQLPRGHVQTLLGNAASFTSNLLHFCQEFEELNCLGLLLDNFLQRLRHCVTAELVPLMELPGVKRARARQLFEAGYRDLQLVAKANPDDLVAKIDPMPRKTANQIVNAAKMLLIQKADELTDDAEIIYAAAKT